MSKPLAYVWDDIPLCAEGAQHALNQANWLLGLPYEDLDDRIALQVAAGDTDHPVPYAEAFTCEHCGRDIPAVEEASA